MASHKSPNDSTVRSETILTPAPPRDYDASRRATYAFASGPWNPFLVYVLVQSSFRYRKV